MHEVSLLRLYLLRALYLLMVVALGIVVWPGIIHHDKPWELMEGVVQCMLGAFALLCALGIRYPLQMLPVLLWELVWKMLWLVVVAVPLWSAGKMDAQTWQVAAAVLWVVIFPFILPWPYLFARYFRQPGVRWYATTLHATASRRQPAP